MTSLDHLIITLTITGILALLWWAGVFRQGPPDFS